MAITVKYALDLFIDEFHHQFNERLALAGNARCRATHHQPKQTESDDAEYGGNDQRVKIDRPEPAAGDLFDVEAKMMLDVTGCCQCVFSGHPGPYLSFSLFTALKPAPDASADPAKPPIRDTGTSPW